MTYRGVPSPAMPGLTKPVGHWPPSPAQHYHAGQYLAGLAIGYHTETHPTGP